MIMKNQIIAICNFVINTYLVKNKQVFKYFYSGSVNR